MKARTLFSYMAGLTGLEPATYGVTGRCCNQLYYSPKKWWAKRGSNPRHPACKAGALPAELFALEIDLNTEMAGLTGLEPATYGVTGRCCNQLYYSPADRNRKYVIAQVGLKTDNYLLPTSE